MFIQEATVDPQDIEALHPSISWGYAQHQYLDLQIYILVLTEKIFQDISNWGFASFIIVRISMSI